MNITTAKFCKDPATKTDSSVRCTIDGEDMFVPIDTKNRHYQAVLEWVDAGNTITASDPLPSDWG